MTPEEIAAAIALAVETATAPLLARIEGLEAAALVDDIIGRLDGQATLIGELNAALASIPTVNLGPIEADIAMLKDSAEAAELPAGQWNDLATLIIWWEKVGYKFHASEHPGSV